MTILIDSFEAFSSSYDVVFCDVWGVLHNGIKAYPGAGHALSRFRAGGGVVILVSNAPRPGDNVLPQLDHWGVRRDAYDLIVTSGDLSRQEITARKGPVFHIGPERDRPLFEGLDATLTSNPEEAGFALCTGLDDDETETAEDYLPLLSHLRAKGIPLICANPDLVVERGARLIPCAGAIAAAYERLGGEALYMGKPHRLIYEEAHQRIDQLRGTRTPLPRILAIGDALHTDIAGAQGYGIDSLLIARGIHQHELPQPLESASLVRWLSDKPHRPKAVMDVLE